MIGAAERIAYTGASDAFHVALRARYGMLPGGARDGEQGDLAYVGREFRVYGYFRIAEAARFYAALRHRWDDATLARALAVAGLEPRFEIRRMKRAYQRALVLCFALAAKPERLVVECGDEFDETPARVLLERAVGDVRHAVVTFADGSVPEAGIFDDVRAATDGP